MSKHLSSKLDDSFRKQFIIDFVEKANTFGTPFLNYLDDKQFENDDNYRTAYLIGENGREKFTKRVLTDIKII